jgi:hypothetical protein
MTLRHLPAEIALGMGGKRAGQGSEALNALTDKEGGPFHSHMYSKFL